MSKERSENGPTIVGGQPAGRRELREGSPRNIEKIVLNLASDDSFRENFIRHRDISLRDAGIVLSSEEKQILGSISDEELLAMAGVLAPGKETSRRRFLRAAASLAALSGLGGLAGGDNASANDIRPRSLGIQPDPVSRGVRPDPTPTPAKPTPQPTPSGGSSHQGQNAGANYYPAWRQRHGVPGARRRWYSPRARVRYLKQLNQNPTPRSSSGTAEKQPSTRSSAAGKTGPAPESKEKTNPRTRRSRGRNSSETTPEGE